MSDRAFVGEFAYDVPSSRWTWSWQLYQLHGLDPSMQPTSDHLRQAMFPEDLPAMEARFKHALRHPGGHTCVYRMTDVAGRKRHLRFVGNAVGQDGVVTSLIGFVLDVTDDVRAWQTSAVDAAMEHRATIEQAKGALMLAFRIDDEEAFALLRSFSMNQNEKLWTVAERIAGTLRDFQNLDGDPVFLLEQLLQKTSPRSSELRPRTTLSEPTQGTEQLGWARSEARAATQRMLPARRG